MGRKFTTPFPGASQAGLGILSDLTIPTALGPSLYAGYIFNNRFGNNPVFDISENGRDAQNIGIDFSRGDFPMLSTKRYLRLPFSPTDFTADNQGSYIIIGKITPGIGKFYGVCNGKDTIGQTINETPDTNSPYLYVDSNDKLIAQMQAGGFYTATSPTADTGATDFHFMGWSMREGDGTGPGVGKIRSYRRRSGQSAIFAQSDVFPAIVAGSNPMVIGFDNFAGNSYQVAAAFFFSAEKTQADFDTAYTAVATLVNPFLSGAGVGTL